MRVFIISILAAALIAGCNMSDKKGVNPVPPNKKIKIDSANLTTIQWLDSTFKDFGKMAEGQKLEVAFRFKNTGDKPLVISKVQPSCGCTVAEQPNEAVAPGNEGVVKATFNSEGRTGLNHKTLFVIANTKGSFESELKFNVEVQKKKF